jgi:hypothetical protein
VQPGWLVCSLLQAALHVLVELPFANLVGLMLKPLLGGKKK